MTKNVSTTAPNKPPNNDEVNAAASALAAWPFLDNGKPSSTVAWDAEEPGLIGSTEWVETHAEELKQKAVAYINTDGTSRGFLYSGGSHTLEQFFDPITREVMDPIKNVSLFERKNAQQKSLCPLLQLDSFCLHFWGY